MNSQTPGPTAFQRFKKSWPRPIVQSGPAAQPERSLQPEASANEATVSNEIISAESVSQATVSLDNNDNNINHTSSTEIAVARSIKQIGEQLEVQSDAQAYPHADGIRGDQLDSRTLAVRDTSPGPTPTSREEIAAQRAASLSGL